MIKIEEISKSYGNKCVLNRVSFQVKSGEFTALVGENGAGKTTLLHILCLAERADSGTVTFFGNKKMTKDTQRSIAMVFQGKNLDEHLSVEENMKFRMLLYGRNRELSEDRSGLIGIKNILNCNYGLLSGGEKRKADLAAALAVRPRLLLMDEPTEGLDEATRNTIWSILFEKKRAQGLSLLYTTHYEREIKYADRVYYLKNGRIGRKNTCQTPLSFEI